MAIKAFVSSTFKDLKKHRRFVIQKLRKAGIHVDPMEDWTADTDRPKTISVDRMRDCQLCILLVAFRRGHIPDQEDRSIVQLEYEAAIHNGIDVLVFLLDEEAPWRRRFDELDDCPPVLRQWREELREAHGVSFFGLEPSSVDVLEAIHRWREQQQLSADTERAPISSELRDPGRPDHSVDALLAQLSQNKRAGLFVAFAAMVFLLVWARPLLGGSADPLTRSLGFAAVLVGILLFLGSAFFYIWSASRYPGSDLEGSFEITLEQQLAHHRRASR